MGIGTNLKLALKEHDLTVAELSRKTGISTNTFYAMIRRDNNKISPEMLKKICDNTDITVYDLLDDYDELAAKYYDPKASKEEQTIGDYILTTMGNDDNLEGIIEIYGKLNNTGKKIAHEKISELEEVPQFTDTDNDIYIDPNLQKLYETAMQKAIHHEELTEEEEQVIIGIPGQLRQKSDSYENSYSFASSEEELNKILKQHQKQREELLLNDYRKLNEIGQLEARKRVSELTEIPRYTKTDELPQD